MHMIPLILAPLLILASATATAQQSEPPPAPVVVAPARMEESAPRVQAPGSVVSRADARLASEVSGTIDWVAEPGAAVAKGEVVARLDAARARLAVRDNEAAVKRLEANASLLRTQRDRLGSLAAQNIASRSQIEEAESRLAMAEQELEQARVARDRAKLDLARSSIRAPFAGQVAARERMAGEFVAVGTPLLRLVDTVNVEVVARAPLSAASALAKGQEVRVLEGDRIVESRIRSVVPVGDERSRMLEVRVLLTAPAWPIGTAVQVELPAGEAHSAVTVPRDAIVQRQGASYVFRVDEKDTVERVSVKAASRGVVARADHVEISGNIEPGDRIVVRGAERLQPGQKVKIQAGEGGAVAEKRPPDRSTRG